MNKKAKTVFVVFVKDLATNVVDPIGGYQNRYDADKFLKKNQIREQQNLNKFLFFITPLLVE